MSGSGYKKNTVNWTIDPLLREYDVMVIIALK